jgi:magnesium-protoporphyrin O-methyltransferase
VDECCGPRTPDGYEQEFDARFARRLAREYRRRGLTPSAQRIVDVARSNDLEGASVLEVGGGIGDIQVELLLHGASRTTNLELSGAYEAEAARLLEERGLKGRAARRLGVDLAVSPDAVEPADIVILHRVVCCYPDYDALLTAAAGHARRAVIFSHPPRTWFTRALLGTANQYYRLTGNPYRAFAHAPGSMIDVLGRNGFTPRYRHRDGPWSIVGAVRI